MNTNRPLVRLAALGTAASLGLVAAPAMAARPVKPAAVTNVTFTATAPVYHLASTWSAGRNATAYQVKLTNAAGTVLDNEKVTTLGWSLDVTTKQAPLGSVVKLAVTSLNGKQKSATVSRTLTMPDVTPPTGSYSAVVDGYTATLTQDTLSDDSGATNVTRTVNWGDGTGDQSWPSGAGVTLTHPYADQGTYTVTVTLSDQAHNTTTVTKPLSVVDHAPTGAFTLGFPTSGYQVTMTQQSLADDITPTGNLQVTVDWGDKTAPEAWAGPSMTHQYPQPETPTAIDHYAPTVTITDTAAPVPNTTVLHPGNVVINDSTPPTGAFALSLPTGSVWAGYTRVSLSQSNVTDGLGSEPQNIVRTVDWGDNSPEQSWTSGAVPTHRYAAAGQYPVTVTLQDEAGNKTLPMSVGTVTVVKDSSAPRVTIKLPARPRNVIKKWRTLRGTARDAGVGVKVVHLQVVEKRGTTYYAYTWSTKRWVKVGHRLGRAWTKAGTAALRPSATHTWAKSVARLRQGVLVFRVNGVDRLNNTSRWLVHSQKLTR